MTIAAPAARAGRIGPNAISRVAEVLPGLVGARVTRRLFEQAGLQAYLQRPPEDMVDEAEVMRLHRVLRDALGGATSAEVARQAGRRTAEYLLARRIPRPVQALLRILPAPLAARVLLRAIAAHAWTFAGSGRFVVRQVWPVVMEIDDNPLCRDVRAERPSCHYYAATFEHLFSTLVCRGAQVVEVACEARGDEACRFELHC